MIFFERVLKALSSLKLAVFTILMLLIISAVGTITEARYDAEYAQALVYNSPFMWAVLILLCVNLIAVMVDRWPWKKRHIGFLMAHIGIILTLIGAFLTQQYGVDGSLAFGIGQTNQYVTVKGREIRIFALTTEGGSTELSRVSTDFLLQPPKKNPFQINFGNKFVKVLDYAHYATRESEIVPSEHKADGPGVRFQLQNANVTLAEWLLKPNYKKKESIDLGPARVILSEEDQVFDGRNMIALKPIDDKKLGYRIFSARKLGMTASGEISEGETVETGWMGLRFQ
ncbi:MAG: hypothetical protein KDD22_08910, partial [Bdellovibrionales bacterium]|nr:hypothetical protein [Bdellovibrionales bacterium]